MSKLGGHLARTSAFNMASLAILSLRGVVLIPLLLGALGAQGYGGYVIALAWTSYGIVAAQLGFDWVVYQYVTPVFAQPRGRAVFWTVFKIGAGWAATVALAAIIAAAVFVRSDLLLVVVGAAGSALGQVLSKLLMGPIRCAERTGLYLTLGTLMVLGEFAVTATSAVLLHSIGAIMCALAVYQLVLAAGYFVYLLRRYPPAPWARDIVVPSIRFGLGGVTTQLISSGYFVWDRTIVSFAAGFVAVAGYAPGMALGGALLPLAAAAVFTLPTLLVNPAVSASPSAKRILLRAALRQYLLLAAPAAIGVALIARPFLSIITTPQLAEVGAPVASLASLAVLASGIGRFAIVGLRAENEDGWLSRSMTAHFAGFVALAIGLAVLRPADAPLMVAGALALANLSQCATAHVRLNRHAPGSIGPAQFLSPLLCAAPFAPLSLVWPMHSVVQTLTFVAGCGALYVVLLMMIERIGPAGIFNALRMPAALDEAPPPEPTGRERIIVHCALNHLFRSTGALYAAELAETYEVHAVVNEHNRECLDPRLLDALSARGITLHWIPDLRTLSKITFNLDLAGRLIELDPAAVFLDCDMGEFNVAIAREATRRGVPVVCFQTGAFGKAPKDDYHYAVQVAGAHWAQERGLPAAVGRARTWLNLHMRHYWHYYLGPILCGVAPFAGPSSIYLRRGHTGQRGGSAYLAYEPGAPELAVEAGTPLEQVVPVRHPLLRSAGRGFFDDAAEAARRMGRTCLILTDLPATATPGADATRTISDVVEATAGLARHFAKTFDHVLVKPRNALPALLMQRLAAALDASPRIELVDPAQDAVSLLTSVQLVIGETSTVLKLARYFAGVTIISTTYADQPRDLFHADSAGMHFFPTWHDVLLADPATLGPKEGDALAPTGAAKDVGLIEDLRRRGVLRAPKEGA